MDRSVGIWIFFVASVGLLVYALFGSHGDDAPAHTYSSASPAAPVAAAPAVPPGRAQPQPQAMHAGTAPVPATAPTTGSATRPPVPMGAPENDTESDDCSQMPLPPGCEPDTPAPPESSDDDAQ
ncbi:MAG TPA: hypothetical protein VHE37_09465 [Nevskiaceae bacterium]|nr:hypothetical protein [Nevskiaceae bacterium]